MKANRVLKILQITRPTLSSYVKLGKIKVTVKPNGDYDYDDDSVFSFAGISANRKTVVYARVSTQKQKIDLENQISTITEYANRNGYKVDHVYSDIASGLSYDRKSFMEMLKDIISHNIKRVVIKDKDRFTRVSFDMWKELFKEFDCEIIVVNETQKSEDDEKEIFSDIISLLHCFAMKMYSQRRKKKITLIEEDMQNEISI